jgi:hypothetical protein
MIALEEMLPETSTDLIGAKTEPLQHDLLQLLSSRRFHDEFSQSRAFLSHLAKKTRLGLIDGVDD